MKIAFFGSGPFAVRTLEALVEACERFPLVRVVSRPDRPAARGRELRMMPVRARALELGVDCVAPESVNSPDALGDLGALGADLFVVADFGEILRAPFLALPRIGAFNLHGSVLPRHRGAAPVARAILAGDTVSGVTLFRIERALDSGPIVAIAKTGIDPNETAGELEARLAELAAELLVEELPRFADGSLTETIQDHAAATLAPKLSKDEGLVDWSRRPRQIHDLVRAMSPWPAAHAFLALGERAFERTSLWRVEPLDDVASGGVAGGGIAGGGVAGGGIAGGGVAGGGGGATTDFGRVVEVTKTSFRIACRGGSVRVLELQREGKAAMAAPAYLNGRRLVAGDRFLGAGEAIPA